MLCKWCNKEVESNAKFCPNCGGSLLNSENQINQPIEKEVEQPIPEPVVNTDIQPISAENINPQPIPETVVSANDVIQAQNTDINTQESKANVGLVILSCLIPLAGLIIFLVKKDDDKKTANASGIAALISFGVSILITIIAIVTLTISANSLINNIESDVQDFVEENDTNSQDHSYDNDIENITTSTEWENYEFTVNNTTLKLPCTYSELSSATSSVMQSSYTKSYLQSGYYALINLYKEDNLALYTELLNDTGADILYTDAKVTRVSQTKYQVSVGAEEIIFPGGLKVGQEITKDELVSLFGEPSDVYNYTSDGYISDTYSYFEDTLYTTTNYYEIRVVNGVIDELSLDNRNYN